eukprot:12022929-Prorocentrum_lima.AAC.1
MHQVVALVETVPQQEHCPAARQSWKVPYPPGRAQEPALQKPSMLPLRFGEGATAGQSNQLPQPALQSPQRRRYTACFWSAVNGP